MVRAKFKCVSVVPSSSTAPGLKNVKLEPVTSGSTENESFFRWRPSGLILMWCVTESANEMFVPGHDYLVDFSRANLEAD